VICEHRVSGRHETRMPRKTWRNRAVKLLQIGGISKVPESLDQLYLLCARAVYWLHYISATFRRKITCGYERPYQSEFDEKWTTPPNKHETATSFMIIWRTWDRQESLVYVPGVSLSNDHETQNTHSWESAIHGLPRSIQLARDQYDHSPRNVGRISAYLHDACELKRRIFLYLSNFGTWIVR